MGPADDPEVLATVLHVGPPLSVRPNPVPKEKYDLVVIGAGVAGLLRYLLLRLLLFARFMRRTERTSFARVVPARITRARAHTHMHCQRDLRQGSGQARGADRAALHGRRLPQRRLLPVQGGHPLRSGRSRG